MATYLKATPVHRAHVNRTVLDIIARRHVLHVDAWLYETDSGDLVFVLETRAGGFDLVQRGAFLVRGNSLHTLPDGCHVEGLQRHINTRWARANAPHLESIHSRLIQPVIRSRRAGFSAVNVLLHYVWIDPNVNEPTAGIENLYGATKRGQRYADTRPQRVVLITGPAHIAEPKPLKLSARDRSVFRTLQKLLD